MEQGNCFLNLSNSIFLEDSLRSIFLLSRKVQVRSESSRTTNHQTQKNCMFKNFRVSHQRINCRP
jgi:hypothetical protein